MNSSNPSNRRRQRPPLTAEALETRQLLTGGAGDTFALIPGTIDKPGGSTAITITLAPPLFTRPRGTLALGIDVAPQQGSTINPFIASIDNPHNAGVPQAFHTVRDPHLLHGQVAQNPKMSAVLVPVTTYPHQPDRPTTYTVNITGENKTSGNFVAGFYLPGDANGDGVVDQSDLQAVRAALGSKVGDAKYNFDADVNRDGRIGLIDLAYTRQNQGARVLVSPLISVNLDPNSTGGATNGQTPFQNVHLTGAVTPGATVTFAELAKKTPTVSTTADANGQYSVQIPLGLGVNTFNVTSADAFGQTISGTYGPLVFTPIMTTTKK